MTGKQLDIFTRWISDVGGKGKTKSLQDMMSRNWFSLSKKKKLSVLEHRWKDSYVRVTAGGDNKGIATIWDYDFLLFAITQMRERMSNGENINDCSLTFTVPDYLLFTNQSLREKKRRKQANISGRQYKDFWSMMERLHRTHIETNIRAGGYTFNEQFVLLSSIAKKELNKKIFEVKVNLAQWFVQRVQEEKQLLTFNEDFFNLTGGLERWLFLYCRKSCGRSKEWKESIKSIYEKSASTDSLAGFKFKLNKIAKRGVLLNYSLMVEGDSLYIRQSHGSVVGKNSDGTKTIEHA